MARPVVLLVEDDDDLRETLVALLLGAGYGVVGAVDGEDAGTLLLGGLVPHVILLDMMLPRRHGAEVLELIDSMQALERVPVIVTSAAPGWASFATGRQREFMPKPFDPAALVARIEELLAAPRKPQLRVVGGDAPDGRFGRSG